MMILSAPLYIKSCDHYPLQQWRRWVAARSHAVWGRMACHGSPGETPATRSMPRTNSFRSLCVILRTRMVFELHCMCL